MQVDVTARHMELTAGLRDHADARVRHAFAGTPKLAKVHVVLSVEKHRHKAEIVLQALHHAIEADAVSDDMYASIDLAIDKAVRQVEKLRDRITDHKGGTSAAG